MRVNLNTFSDVAERYAEVKPMVSKNHKREDDIRPISERHRKWERIAKVDDNCYILHDVIPYENYSWVDEHLKRPPITWSRDKHGDEFVLYTPLRGVLTKHGWRFYLSIYQTGWIFVGVLITRLDQHLVRITCRALVRRKTLENLHPLCSSAQIK